jgi:hypothetical protein
VGSTVGNALLLAGATLLLCLVAAAIAVCIAAAIALLRQQPPPKGPVGGCNEDYPRLHEPPTPRTRHERRS